MSPILQPKLFDLVASLSSVADWVSASVVNHNMQVAYISCALAREMGYSDAHTADIALAAALHDIGAFSLQEKLTALDFDVRDPHRHAETGYALLRMFAPFDAAASFVRFHHVRWDHGRSREFKGKPVPVESHIIHLADRIAVLLPRGMKLHETMGLSAEVRERIAAKRGAQFMPEAVDAFLQAADRADFWLEVCADHCPSLLRDRIGDHVTPLDADGVLEFARLMARMIDFRSHWTATHSSGVAECSAAVGELAGHDADQCRLLKVAGLLHDLGKLAVPPEILDKTQNLTVNDWKLIRSHPAYTYRALKMIQGSDEVRDAACRHHERLDGNGYPFKLGADELRLDSRVLAVADVFTAITEDRPYRAGMTSEKALGVLGKMAASRQLDPDMVALIDSNFDEINGRRMTAQTDSVREYKEFINSV